MTIIEDRLSVLDNLKLAAGAHSPTADEMCAMEAVAFVAGEPWSDHPQCASPVIGAFMRKWNDLLDDEGRQELKPYIPRLVGTKAGQATEDARGWLCADWMVRSYLPPWLRAAGMEDQAQQIEALPKITSRSEWSAFRQLVLAVRDASWKRRQEMWAPTKATIIDEVRKRVPDADAADAAAAVAATAVADAAAAAAHAAAADAAEAAAGVAAAAAAAHAAAAHADTAAAADAAAHAAAAADAAAAVAAAAAADATTAIAAAAAAIAAIAAIVADADAAARHNQVWWAVYKAVMAKFAELIEEAHPGLQASAKESAFALLETMIALHPGPQG